MGLEYAIIKRYFINIYLRLMPNSEEPNAIWGQRLKVDQAVEELKKLGIAVENIDALFPLLHSDVHRTVEASLSKSSEGKILLTGMSVYGFSDVIFVYRYDPVKKESVPLFEFEHRTFGTTKADSLAAMSLPLGKRAPHAEVLEGLCKFLDLDMDKLLVKFPLIKDFTGDFLLRLSPRTAILAVNAMDAGMKSSFSYEYNVTNDTVDLVSNMAAGVRNRVVRRGRR